MLSESMIPFQVMHQEEQLWNYLTAMLKGSEQHLNLRMFVRNGHCLQLERKNAQTMLDNLARTNKQL